MRQAGDIMTRKKRAELRQQRRALRSAALQGDLPAPDPVLSPGRARLFQLLVPPQSGPVTTTEDELKVKTLVERHAEEIRQRREMKARRRAQQTQATPSPSDDKNT